MDRSLFPKKICVAMALVAGLNFFIGSVCQAYVVDVAGSGDAIFLLDDKGSVWAFRRPLSLEEPVKLPNLRKIRKISSFLALDEEGHVFRWAFAKETQMPDADTVIAAYTTPELVPDLDEISTIAGYGSHDIAVKNDREIFEWESVPREGFGIKGYSPTRRVFDGPDIRSVSVNGDGAILVLSRNGSVFGLGLSPSGQVQKDAVGKQVPFPVSSPATAVYLNSTHAIILSEDGRARYWGGCNTVRKATGGEASRGSISGVEGAIEDVAALSAPGDDNIAPAVFLKRDGTVWVAYAPVPSGQNAPSCDGRPETVPAVSRLGGIDTIVTKIVGGGPAGVIVALGADHSMWRASYENLAAGFSKIDMKIP